MFVKCLFEVSLATTGPDCIVPPKCKNGRSRKAAFKLLAHLAKARKKSYNDLLNMLSHEINQCKVSKNATLLYLYTRTSLGVIPENIEELYYTEKGGPGFMGLQNLGYGMTSMKRSSLLMYEL